MVVGVAVAVVRSGMVLAVLGFCTVIGDGDADTAPPGSSCIIGA